jgi:hypothetical protein
MHGVCKKARRIKKVDRDASCRNKIYSFEDGWLEWSQNSLTLQECRIIIRKACRLFGVPPPTVVQHKKRGYSFYHPDHHQISLEAQEPNNRGGKNRATCLHEAAHAIVWRKKPKALDHGAYFASVYINLLARARVAPLSALEAAAHEQGIRFKCKN